jgi:hypothetical protein
MRLSLISDIKRKKRKKFHKDETYNERREELGPTHQENGCVYTRNEGGEGSDFGDGSKLSSRL